MIMETGDKKEQGIYNVHVYHVPVRAMFQRGKSPFYSQGLIVADSDEEAIEKYHKAHPSGKGEEKVISSMSLLSCHGEIPLATRLEILSEAIPVLG